MQNYIQKNKQGQGLVEFALILPMLLMMLIGILEFGRFFIIYASVANAVREGARVGVVNPTDQATIADTVHDFQVLVDLIPEISYQNQATGVIHTNPSQVSIGDRIIVRATFDVDPLTPFFTPFIREDLQMHTEVKRTIRSMKTTVSTYVPAPTITPGGPTLTYTPLAGPTNTPAPTRTLPPTGTGTATAGPTATPLSPIIIWEPIYDGYTYVEGEAANGMIVTLRVVQTGLVRSVAVDATTGRFRFDNLPALSAGYTVVVQGYNEQDTAVVQALATNTPVPPTATPATVSGTPTYVANGTIYLSSDVVGMNVLTCLPTGTKSAFVQGRYWAWDNKVNLVRIKWDASTVAESGSYLSIDGYYGFRIPVTLNVGATPNPHVLSAEARDSKKDELRQGPVSINVPVCVESTPTPVPPTATPTAAPEDYPDLTIIDITVLNEPPVATYEDIIVNVQIANLGDTDVSGLFWLDLYANPETGVDLESQVSSDYLAINAFASNTTISTTMIIRDGFSTVGTHHVQAMIDTYNLVAETNELNNESALASVLIAQVGPTPLPTATPSSEEPGSISGLTSLLVVGQGFLDQDRVAIYVYDPDGRLVASTRSITDGEYLIDNISPGTYTMEAYYRQGDTNWYAVYTGVPVTSATDTYVEIVLYEVVE